MTGQIFEWKTQFVHVESGQIRNSPSVQSLHRPSDRLLSAPKDHDPTAVSNIHLDLLTRKGIGCFPCSSLPLCFARRKNQNARIIPNSHGAQRPTPQSRRETHRRRSAYVDGHLRELQLRRRRRGRRPRPAPRQRAGRLHQPRSLRLRRTQKARLCSPTPESKASARVLSKLLNVMFVSAAAPAPVPARPRDPRRRRGQDREARGR